MIASSKWLRPHKIIKQNIESPLMAHDESMTILITVHHSVSFDDYTVLAQY